MHKVAFEALFEECVARRLVRSGFKPDGKALFFFDERLTMALFRLGGRMSSAGAIAHILCFRHSFLRDRTETVPTKAPREVYDYPYKFRPLEDADRELIYRPQVAGYDFERLVWENAAEGAVRQKLDRIADNIECRFLPWADALPLATAKSQIAQFGDDAWCERMWIEDYAKQLGA